GRKLTLGFVFVREEQHIDAVRHVVRGNSYTFEVVLIANLNTSLYESITTHVYVFSAWTNMDCTIVEGAGVFDGLNSNTLWDNCQRFKPAIMHLLLMLHIAS